MQTVREILVVEGKYDEIRLSSVVKATVVTTGGFRVFQQPEELRRLRSMAKDRGVIVLTDSDGAGLVIRNFLQGALGNIPVRHAYIPRIAGKERRKHSPSKEGFLGVEGMDADVLLSALRAAGATIGDVEVPAANGITKARLYEDGLTGRADSAARRRAFLEQQGLPPYLSTQKLLQWIQTAMTEQAYAEAVRRL